jgi:hypothetical protein
MEDKKEKRGFNSEKEVREELERIINTNYNSCKMIKPCRYYQENGFWYLTSQKKITIY